MFAYYHADCPTCKNYNLLLIEQEELKLGIKLDKRYIYVLPDIWGEDARKLATPLPFIVNLKTRETLHIDHNDNDMATKIADFVNENIKEM